MAEPFIEWNDLEKISTVAALGNGRTTPETERSKLVNNGTGFATPSRPSTLSHGTTTEQLFSEVLAEIMEAEQVPVDSHFFDELGADSMVMARFCARIRKRDDLPRVSIKDVYGNPTIRSLAAAMTEALAETSTTVTEAVAETTITETNVATAINATATEQHLSEILAEIMDAEQVPVDSHFFDELGADSMVMARFCARIRKQDDLPTVSIKDVYACPTIQDLASTFADAGSTAAAEISGDTSGNLTEQRFSEVLAELMDVGQVLTDSHFFDELGADSMVMARFCARIRKRADLPSISIKDVYAHPTISSLAAAFADDPLIVPVTVSDASPASVTPPVSTTALAPRSALVGPIAQAPIPDSVQEPVGKAGHFLCGALQLLTIFGYIYLTVFVLELGYKWTVAGSGFIGLYIRALLVAGGLFLFTSILPISMKWMLIGRWKPQQIRIWSLAYYRFWLVKFLLRLNPLVVFVGSPLYILYLRALGAKIGRGVVILSPHVPICTDLLTIGDNTVIRKDAFFNCYRGYDGFIQTGSVTIGSNAYVGEMTVLDIDSTLGDGAQLGHSSSLDAGQSVPDGEHRCGSPARERTEVNYRGVETTFIDPLRKAAFTAAQLINTFLLSSIVYVVVIMLIPIIAETRYFAVLEIPLSPWVLLGEAVLITMVLFFGAILLGLITVVTVPRLLNLTLEPDKVYPLYGFRYWAHRAIGRITNAKFYLQLFGDSAYIVYYLRWLGYDFREPFVQTGSNFGTAVKHDNPFLVSIGGGTIIADGLSSINADYSSTSFRLSQVTIGANSFLGNNIAYPAQGKTGDNCLLATKVLVPVDGEVREDVGLLGAPSFNIPRSVQRDIELEHPQSDEELVHKLTAKTEHNLVTMVLFLLTRWFSFFVTIMLFYGAVQLYPIIGVSAFALALLLRLLFAPFYAILVERTSTFFQKLQPQQCSIYEPYFWFHERYWKLSVLPTQLTILDGTPLKSFAWRLLGAQIGKRVFDDGAALVEKTMIAIGDNCTLNAGCVIQPHSQEDGGFKSDYITIGANCTLGVGSFVHYGTTIGDGAELAADSFLMKGGQVSPYTQWGDNPAMELSDNSSVEISTKASLPLLQTTDKIDKLEDSAFYDDEGASGSLPIIYGGALTSFATTKTGVENELTMPVRLPKLNTTAHAYFKYISGGTHLPHKIPLEGHEMVRMGRNHSSCERIISDLRVSRLHATITSVNGDFYIKDEGSAGGTFVNYQRLGPIENRMLKHKDIVGFNEVEYRFEISNLSTATVDSRFILRIIQFLSNRRHNAVTGTNGGTVK